MYIFVFSVNMMALLLGILFNLATYFINEQLISDFVFNCYFIFALIQTIILFIILLTTNNDDERGIPVGKILLQLDNKVRYLLIFVLLLGVVIISYSISLMSGGGPEMISGKYFLIDKGKILKEISFEDYKYFQLLTLRMTSYIAAFFIVIDIILLNFITNRKNKI